MLASFTQQELDDNWVADRQYPSGGVESVSFDGRDSVAKISIIGDEQDADLFKQLEGIKKVEDFGLAVQVDLYVDSDWQDQSPVNVGFWASDDPIFAYPIIVYRNSDTVDAGFYTWEDDWDAGAWGYVRSDVAVNYDGWNTLSITLDTDNDVANYAINGEDAGTSPLSRPRLQVDVDPPGAYACHERSCPTMANVAAPPPPSFRPSNQPVACWCR